MSAQAQVWADTLGADSSTLADSLDDAPYRAELPVFGSDPDEQVNVLRAAVAVAAVSACFYIVVVGLWVLL